VLWFGQKAIRTAMNANLILAWLWILLGFVSGMALGLFFHQEKWLGGYGSLKRRMYRLGHISFFGLGVVNLLFWVTVRQLQAGESQALAASWAFIIGALSMPACCLAMAHFRKAHFLFALPVASLLAGAALTCRLILLQSETHHLL
jgi:hypothetical protein